MQITAQNQGNGISEDLNFENFPGEPGTLLQPIEKATDNPVLFGK